MKKWEKPTLTFEKIELSQTIATGCSVIPQEGEILIQSCCKPGTEEYYNKGSNHPYIEKYLVDLDGNGKITADEFQDAVDACAAAFADAGTGHLDVHSTTIKYNGDPIPEGMFSS